MGNQNKQLIKIASIAAICILTTVLIAHFFTPNLNRNNIDDFDPSLRKDGHEPNFKGADGSDAKYDEDFSSISGNVVTALAIGDWGSTLYKQGSCCNKYRKTSSSSQEFFEDFWAQKNLAFLLAKSAANVHPQVIIGHGDNFYWNGLGTHDRDSRFTATFEEMYDQPELEGIKWINVVGNHDLGGAHFLCGKADNKFHQCESISEMKDALISKFDKQASYVSPNQNRWYMPDHYFKYTIKNGDVTVDIFNVDTNYADSHGGMQICCQCYGYSPRDWTGECNDVYPGHMYCAGGDLEMYNICMNIIKGWWDDSIDSLKQDLSKSKADYKIINSHYSPLFHMGEPKQKLWMDILKDYNVQIFLNGHTHGENHDYAEFGTHFFENGAGGGIQSEASGIPAVSGVENIWIGAGAPYGFFEMYATKKWLKMRFITFDEDWIFDKDISLVKQGSGRVDHCWLVPKDGSRGQECEETFEIVE